MRFLSLLLCFLLVATPAFADEYDDARKISDRLAFGTIELAPYEGGPEDLAYLKKYVVDLAAESYSVEASVFDRPTLLSTSLLRDLVSKMNHQQPPGQKINTLLEEKKLKYKIRKDAGEMWRYPSWGVCAHVTFALYNIYKSLGYKTRRIDTINGTPDRYTQSHAMTEVYVEDLGKYILQDAQLNMAATDAAGNFLSFDETKAMLDRGENPVFRTFLFSAAYPYTGKNYDSFPMTPIPYPGMDFVFDINNIRANYYRNVYKTWTFDGRKEIYEETR